MLFYAGHHHSSCCCFFALIAKMTINTPKISAKTIIIIRITNRKSISKIRRKGVKERKGKLFIWDILSDKKQNEFN